MASGKEIYFLPLGGAGEVGMNLSLYRIGDDFLVVDCGIIFNSGLEYGDPGIDISMADISFIEETGSRICGIVLTHAHEDHIGGLPYLWRLLSGPPIWCNAFTATILELRLEEFGLIDEVEINIVDCGQEFVVGNFTLELVSLSHSIPYSSGLVIGNGKDKIFHTGDFNIDRSPDIFSFFDEERLKALGDEGVLGLVCDSTNILSEESFGSEQEVRDNLKEIICSYKKGSIFVTCFASNISRLLSIARAAHSAGRKVCLCGRSMWRYFEAAQSYGFFSSVDSFLEPSSALLKRGQEVLFICTGCQGEDKSAISRISSLSHPEITISKDDLVIFSSSIIPGNECSVYRIYNNLSRLGVRYITSSDARIHASGHAGIKDLEYMYSLIRPQILLPVHGEYRHLYAHMSACSQYGIKSILVENGQIVCLRDGNSSIVDKVSSGRLCCLGNKLHNASERFMRRRRYILKQGMVLIVIILDSKGKLGTDPIIHAPLLIDEKKDSGERILVKISEKLKSSILSLERKKLSLSEKHLSKIAYNTAQRFIKRDLGLEPLTEIKVIRER